jgi:putative peptidoglycan lipid II flippase
LRLTGDVSGLPTSILQAALLSVLLTHLSEDAAKNDYAAFRDKTRGAMRVAFGSLAAACLVLHFVRVPLLRFVFEHGSMDHEGVVQMAEILPYYLVGIPSFGVLLVLVRAHIAAQNSRIMMKMGILNACLNFAGNAALGKVFGLRGIALSTSLVHVGVAGVLYVLLQKRLAELEGKPS